MEQQQALTLPVEFTHSREKRTVDLERLQVAVVEFLEFHTGPPLIDPAFRGVLGDGDGETRFRRLLEATGWEEDPAGFFDQVIHRLEPANDENPADLEVNGVRLPYHLGMTILEEILPGNRIFDVKSPQSLERLTNTRVPPEDKAPLR